MTRTTTGLCIAAALGFAASVGAQSTTSTTTSGADQRTGTMNSARSNHEVTVTGCLARGADGTFMLNNARMDDNMSSSRSSTGSNPTSTTASPNPSTTTAGAATGTTGSGSVGTTAAEPSATTTTAQGNQGASAWKLEGGTDLERHLGHEIQVTGRSDWNGHSSSSAGSPATTTAGTTGSTAGAATGTTAGSSNATTTADNRSNEPRLEVSSVKMISSSCR